MHKLVLSYCTILINLCLAQFFIYLRLLGDRDVLSRHIRINGRLIMQDKLGKLVKRAFESEGYCNFDSLRQ